MKAHPLYHIYGPHGPHGWHKPGLSLVLVQAYTLEASFLGSDDGFHFTQRILEQANSPPQGLHT